MASRISISESELLQALASLGVQDAPADAMTSAEIGAAMGLKPVAVRVRLAKLRAEGRLETWTVIRPDSAGRRQQIPAYTIKPAPKRKR